MWRASGTVTAANRVIYYSSKYHLSFGIYLSKIQGTLARRASALMKLLNRPFCLNEEYNMRRARDTVKVAHLVYAIYDGTQRQPKNASKRTLIPCYQSLYSIWTGHCTNVTVSIIKYKRSNTL